MTAHSHARALGVVPECCTYHRTGGFGFVGCKADEFEPEIHEDAPVLEGSIRDGLRAYDRSRRLGDRRS